MTTEAKEPEVKAPEAKEPEKPADKPKPEGWEQVELSPEQQKRFNRLYAQMKTQDGALKEMGGMLRKLIDDVTDLRGAKAAQELTRLNDEADKAFAEGDYKKARALMTQAITAELKPAMEGKPEAKKSSDDGAQLSPDQEKVIQRWAAETNEDGSLKRPWVQQGHPKQKRAAAIAMALFEDPDYAEKTTDEILSEVDRLMGLEGPKPKATQPAVLGNGATLRKPAQKNPSLTEEEKMVARKMGMTYERYAAAKYGE